MKYGIAVVCAALAAGTARAETDKMATAMDAKVANATDAKTASASDEKAVARIATDWTDAWNRHDAEGLATVFSERGDMINPKGEVAKGHQQILKLLQTEQAGQLKQSKMALTCEPARFFDANVAGVDCDFTVEGIIGPEAPAMLRGHVTNVVVRDGARWSIASLRAMVPQKVPTKTADLAAPATPR